IGDDGVGKLQIGKETPLGEAYTAFQRYCLSLRERGVLLAVCSKNDPEIAKSGFEHPDSILKLSHFSSFQASWDPKPEGIEKIANDHRFVPIYGRLSDVFGDNGLVSVIISRLEEAALQLDLWVMSCRVLKRQMEFAMLDMLVVAAKAAGASKITGRYSRTPKNGMVADHYRSMGFQLVSAPDDLDHSTWELDLSTYSPKTAHIRIL